jgi:hypothetical protein
MEALCIFRQVNTLKVAAADITEVLPLMKVSDHLSDIAENHSRSSDQHVLASPDPAPWKTCGFASAMPHAKKIRGHCVW